MSYSEALWRELGGVGIRGRLRARIIAEIDDHLASDPGADLGAPDHLARQFADQLGTSLALRAALGAFAALAFAGAMFGAAFLARAGLLRSATGTARPFGDLAGALIVVGAQVALVAGTLAGLRALRRRRAMAIGRGEATVILRRATVAVMAGLVTMAGLAWLALILGRTAPGWWVTLTLALSAAGAVALMATAPLVLAAARVRPATPGPGGDLADDLGVLMPGQLRDRPWSLALAVAGAVAVVIALAGVVASDPFDGALRGLADGAACLLGFAVLGRYLGLRR